MAKPDSSLLEVEAEIKRAEEALHADTLRFGPGNNEAPGRPDGRRGAELSGLAAGTSGEFASETDNAVYPPWSDQQDGNAYGGAEDFHFGSGGGDEFDLGSIQVGLDGGMPRDEGADNGDPVVLSELGGGDVFFASDLLGSASPPEGAISENIGPEVSWSRPLSYVQPPPPPPQQQQEKQQEPEQWRSIPQSDWGADSDPWNINGASAKQLSSQTQPLLQSYDRPLDEPFDQPFDNQPSDDQLQAPRRSPSPDAPLLQPATANTLASHQPPMRFSSKPASSPAKNAALQVPRRRRGAPPPPPPPPPLPSSTTGERAIDKRREMPSSSSRGPNDKPSAKPPTTTKPAGTSKPQPPGKPPIQRRLEELSRSATARRVELARRQEEEAAAKHARECTFTPKLIARPRSRSRANSAEGRARSSDGGSSDQRSHKWGASAAMAAATRRSWDGSKSMDDGMLGSSSSTSSGGERGDAAAAAGARLFGDASEREALRVAVAVAVEEAERAECNFTPAINAKSDAILEAKLGSGGSSDGFRGYMPLHERASALMREKLHHVAALRSVHVLGDPNLTFEPRLNEKSRALAEKRRQSSPHETSGGDRDSSGDNNDHYFDPHDAGSRLSMEAKLLAEKRLAAVEARAKALAAAHPFAPPGMSAKSRQALAEDPKLGALSFLGRQLFFAKQEEAAAAARAKAAEEERAALFKPNIAKSQSVVGPRTSSAAAGFGASPPQGMRDSRGSGSGAHPRDGNGVESAEARALRLSVVDRERIQARKKLAEETYYKQFNYKPSINPVSKALGRGSQSVAELSCNPRGAEARKRAAAAEEARRKAAETFKPTLLHTKSTAADRGKRSSSPKTTSTGASSGATSKAPLRPRKENAGGNNANGASSSTTPSHQHRVHEEAHHPPRTSLKDPAARLAEIHQRRAAADAWRNAQLAEREMKELEGCTFSPQKATTDRNSSRNRGAAANNGSYKQSSQSKGRSSGNPVVVRGLGRYLEVRDLAKKQREEKAAAEAKAARGWVSGKGRPHTGTTQPKPFQLSGPRDPAAKEKLAREAEAKFSESCTFRPRTNESVGRAVAGALLDDDDDVDDRHLDHHLDHSDLLEESGDFKEGLYENEGGADFGLDWQAGIDRGHSKAAPLPGFDYEENDGGYGSYDPAFGGYDDGYDDDGEPENFR